MSSKAFIAQRISIYAGSAIDPDSDIQVKEMLRNKFNIHLPQRSSMIESLTDAITDHEILQLLIQYRTL